MIPTLMAQGQEAASGALQKKEIDRAKGEAGRPDQKRLKQQQLQDAARSFDALFMSMLMKSMRSTIHKSGFINGGQGEAMFTELLDQRVAETASKRGGGLGIAGLIIKRYSKHVNDYENTKGAKLDVKP